MQDQQKKIYLRRLVSELVEADKERQESTRKVNRLKAKIMEEGLVVMADTNTRYVRFAGTGGSVSVTDALQLSVINDDGIRQALPEGVYDKFVKKTENVEYKYDAKLEAALKAVFMMDYSFEMDLEEFLEYHMSIHPSAGQKKVLLKKLKGDYVKDMALLCSVFNTEDGQQFDVDLYYIYKIKNAELIRRFLPEEGIDGLMAEMRKCMIVENSTKITIEADEMEGE